MDVGALVKCKNFASPRTTGETIGSGNTLKLFDTKFVKKLTDGLWEN
jgi:hypothetical protein